MRLDESQGDSSYVWPEKWQFIKMMTGITCIGHLRKQLVNYIDKNEFAQVLTND